MLVTLSYHIPPPQYCLRILRRLTCRISSHGDVNIRVVAMSIASKWHYEQLLPMNVVAREHRKYVLIVAGQLEERKEFFFFLLKICSFDVKN